MTNKVKSPDAVPAEFKDQVDKLEGGAKLVMDTYGIPYSLQAKMAEA